MKKAPFPDFPDLIVEYPWKPKHYCDFCGMPVYLVQNAQGERFIVGHDGTRWCRFA